MMNEIINKIFVVGEFKRHAEFELNEFKKEFGEYIAKNFSDRVILKNGVEIIAISAIEFRRVKVRDFKACHSEDFMRYVYRNKVKELQQENQQLKEKYEKLQEAFKKAITTEHHKIHELLDTIDEAKTAVDYMIGNVDISEIHGTKLKQILDKAGDIDEKKN